MKKHFFFLFTILLSLFSCTENPASSSDEEVWELVNQTVSVFDTVFFIDKNGMATSEIVSIDTVSIPIRTQSNETWTFKNDTLHISTDLGKGNIQNLDYQVVRQKNGFHLKRKNENEFCKIIKKDDKEMILETHGKIVLRRVK